MIDDSTHREEREREREGERKTERERKRHPIRYSHLPSASLSWSFFSRAVVLHGLEL
ncbi:hypothetical protein PDJAM_G00270340, partial [Pangasius djambal]|nr:hypothetical protein [Pangasius djambal]